MKTVNFIINIKRPSVAYTIATDYKVTLMGI